jgi:pectate lyase
MKKQFVTIAVGLLTVLTTGAADYDQDAPFGFCTRSSRTDKTSTYTITGGGCHTYPLLAAFKGKSIVLKSNGEDMKSTISNAFKSYDVIIFDGSGGDFIVSSNIAVPSNRTLLGINKARLTTKWFVTKEIKDKLDAAGVPNMSTSSGGSTLPNGTPVNEECEYNTRRILIELTGDTKENYRNSGLLSLSKCSNVIIRNLTFQGPGSIDVGGKDLISATQATHCWVDHCAFMDGQDGNFDITQKSNYFTVSWCTFSYTDRSYMHQNTNLIGSSDSETTGYLNTTFAFNWWGTGCKQRMPMARVGKIHMLNNYFTCSGSSNCINPRKNSEFLVEGNYIATGVNNYYGQSGAIAVTWKSDNLVAASKKTHSSFGSTVTVPYDYSVAPANEVPTVVKAGAGPTLFAGNPTPVQTPVASTENPTTSKYAYSLSGQRIGSNYRGLVIKNGRKTLR